ncbi:MAG: VanW family protein [Candidatus Shapirobacteria bacterium]
MSKKLLPLALLFLILFLLPIWKLSQNRLSLEQKALQFPPRLILQYQEQVWFLDLGKINFHYQLPRYLAFNSEFQYTLDQTLLEQQLQAISQSLNFAPVEPNLEIVDQQVVIDPGQNGQELNLAKLRQLLQQRFTSADPKPIDLPITFITPQLDQPQINELQRRANLLLEKKLILSNPPNRWEVNDKELVRFLQSSQLNSWVDSLSETINRPPENAVFQFKNNKIALFRPGKDGQTLKKEATIQLVNQALEQLMAGSRVDQTLSLPLELTPPAITTSSVNDLGIEGLLATGVSFFAHSIPSRIHNLTLAASHLNGRLIAPEEIFSFNQSLGDVSAETGYQPAYIIKEGRTVLGDGGGVCQVSTTLFRAILNTGLPILERHAHAYRVSYYEQQSPPGLDATVFDPGTDFKFQNDTGHYLLIQSTVDKKSQKLTFEIYGTADDRQITISPSKVSDQSPPPPPDLYQDDPTLPIGQIKQVDWSAWGAKVSFHWQVTRNGQLLQDKTFTSTYRPWQAIYLRGTAPL